MTVKPEVTSSGSENEADDAPSTQKEIGIKRYDLPENVKFKNALTFEGTVAAAGEASFWKMIATAIPL